MAAVAKGKSPAFSFYANDWLGSLNVAMMTPEEEGAYIRLLCYAWGDPDCSLPDDDNALASLSRLGERWFNGRSTNVRKCFEPHPEKPGRIYNKRLSIEREKQVERSVKNSEAGVKSGQSRRCGTNKRSAVVQPKTNERSTNVEQTLNLPSSSSSSSSSLVLAPLSAATLEGVSKRHSSSKADNSAEIRLVFDHYRTYHERAHRKPNSGSKEWRKIALRLKDGYSVEDLCRAIDGCHRSPWHCGENPGNTLYQNLELIMRDSDHVRQFLEVPEFGQGQPVLSEREMRGKRAADSWLQKSEEVEHEQV